MDERIRKLERDAALGDIIARAALEAAMKRVSDRPERPPIPKPMPEGKAKLGAWEAIQRDPELQPFFTREEVLAQARGVGGLRLMARYRYFFMDEEIRESLTQFVLEVLPGSWAADALRAYNMR